MLQLPFIINLDIPGAKEFVNNAIREYGVSKDVNQVGTRVNCKDANGNPFTILQFNGSRNLARFGGDGYGPTVAAIKAT